MIFNRRSFGSGVMVMDTVGSDGKPSKIMLTAQQNGKDIGEGPEQNGLKAKYPEWFMNAGEHNAKKAERKKNKDDKKARKY